MWSGSVRVDFKRHEWDRKIDVLAREGFYSTAIYARLRKQYPWLTLSRVRYRIKESGAAPNLHRRGLTDRADAVFRRVDRRLSRIVGMIRELKEDVRVARRNLRRQYQ